ncbi:MAG: hypothetical protein OHK0046_25250 [Anaerolineae bacterium]
MTSHELGTPPVAASQPASETAFYLLMGIIMLVIMGVFTAVFSLTYIHDMSMLQNVPEMVWTMICGQPSSSGTTLPLLVTISLVSFIGSGVLFVIRWWILRRSASE